MVLSRELGELFTTGDGGTTNDAMADTVMARRSTTVAEESARLTPATAASASTRAS